MYRTTGFTALLLILPCLAAAQTPASRDTITSFAVSGWGVARGDGDPAVRPGDDFFRFQNGAWFAQVHGEAPQSMNSYWRDLKRLAPRRLTDILQEAAAHGHDTESPEGKAGAFYRSFMNQGTVESRGLGVLEPGLAAIRRVRDHAQLAELMGVEGGPEMPRTINLVVKQFPPGAFSVTIQQDARHPEAWLVNVGAAGMLLPSPDYYSNSRNADIKTAYEAYIAQVLEQLGWESPYDRARDIVALETRIAAVSWSLEQLRDVLTTDNRMTVAELAGFAPGFDWHGFLRGAGLGKVSKLTIDAKSSFPALARIFAETPIAVWQARQAFAIADRDAIALNDSLYRTSYRFRNVLFNGASIPGPSRASRAWMITDGSIGEIMGDLYARRFVPASTKAVVAAMAENIRGALDARLARAEWLSPASKAKARAKLASTQLDISNPERFEQYEGLVVRDDDLYGNVMRARAFAWTRRITDLGHRFDRTRWPLPWQNVTYWYDVPTNTVEVPAGLIEPPFFDIHADPAVNFGALGTQIGQMFMGAFDDVGRHFDGMGRREELFTPEESEHFLALRRALSAQYSAIEPIPGFHVQGDLVVDEAIADVEGIQIALDAYHASLKGQPAPVVAGYSGDQRFFLGRAQMWRAHFAEAFTKTILVTGQNAPPFLRVNATVRHLDAWYDAFGVQPGDKMYIAPEKRVVFW